MRKINFKQPKYILPLVVFLPLVFLGYTLSQLLGGGDDGKKEGVVTDNINMTLPDARSEGLDNKMAEMSKRFSEDGAYTAIGALGDEKQQQDSTQSGYQEHELNQIDAENARREQKQRDVEELERSLAESRRHINSYSGRGSGGSSRSSGSGISRQEELDDYARELEYIQNRSRERQRMMEDVFGTGSNGNSQRAEANGSSTYDNGNVAQTTDSTARKKEEKAEVVQKVSDPNADKFNTIDQQQSLDEPLIKAMIDKTTKAHEGTRLRFKLLDDVVIKNTTLKKGTYLYGTVTGFGQQRVMASITSILIGDKFVKVDLSVFDNDGMEGFYVPESAFRDMMRDAGSQAMQSNITFDSDGGYGLSGEALALQALQNMYQSASSAISGNIRKNKARIKYNTIVYLVNADAISGY